MNNVMLAQEDAGGLPDEATAVTGDPGAPGAAGGGGAAPGNPFGSQFMLFALVILVVMIVVSTIGPRREKKRREAMISAIKKHDRVQTVGGVIGAIVEVKPEFVVLKVDESANTRITFARSAIQQVLSSKETKEEQTQTNASE
ncbi:MAG: preprotein translocase subunit YajC [Planctomycetes bacterium]|nr:preprotein translocase subunit YajC [Planctomycetota bacterium]